MCDRFFSCWPVSLVLSTCPRSDDIIILFSVLYDTHAQWYDTNEMYTGAFGGLLQKGQINVFWDVGDVSFAKEGSEQSRNYDQ